MQEWGEETWAAGKRFKVARLEAAKENLRIEIAELRHDEKQAKVQQRIRAAKEKMFSSEKAGGELLSQAYYLGSRASALLTSAKGVRFR